jgi:hypothetical protein
MSLTNLVRDHFEGGGLARRKVLRGGRRGQVAAQRWRAAGTKAAAAGKIFGSRVGRRHGPAVGGVAGGGCRHGANGACGPSVRGRHAALQRAAVTRRCWSSTS